MKTNLPYIYIVDDDSFSLKYLQYFIRKNFDCNVRSFSSAEECISTLNNRVPNLIISDYYLDNGFDDNMTGKDFLVKIKSTYPKLPVVIYSAANSEPIADDVIAEGASTFISKNENFIPEIANETEKIMEKERIVHKHQLYQKNLLLLVLLVIIVAGSLYLLKPEWKPFLIGASFIMTLGIAVVWWRTRQKINVELKI